MEALPSELLYDVLARLAPADLVAARKVCMRWRAVVTAMEARDRPFRFLCGVADVETQKDQRARWATYCIDLYSEIRTLPCTCGAVCYGESYNGPFAGSVRNAQHRDRVCAAFQQYAHRHAQRLPPARWEVLAREHALAMKLWSLGGQMWRHVHALQYEYAHGGGLQAAWLPCWIFLPPSVVRPSSPALVGHLVHDILKKDQEECAALFDLLSQPSSARAYYAAAATAAAAAAEKARKRSRPPPERAVWWDAWRFQVPERGLDANSRATRLPACYSWDHRYAFDGWERWQFDARREAAKWRVHVKDRGDGHSYHRMDGADDSVAGRPWGELTDAETVAIMDSQVAAVDRIKAEVEALLTHAVVVGERRYREIIWMGGLSPAGHLVGAMTLYRDGD